MLFVCAVLKSAPGHGRGRINTSKPVSVPETRRFIFNAPFVPPPASQTDPASLPRLTDRRAERQKGQAGGHPAIGALTTHTHMGASVHAHNLISAREKNMADGLTAALSPQSNFVVSYQLSAGKRCQWQAGSDDSRQLRGFVSPLLCSVARLFWLRRRTTSLCCFSERGSRRRLFLTIAPTSTKSHFIYLFTSSSSTLSTLSGTPQLSYP